MSIRYFFCSLQCTNVSHINKHTYLVWCAVSWLKHESCWEQILVTFSTFRRFNPILYYTLVLVGMSCEWQKKKRITIYVVEVSRMQIYIDAVFASILSLLEIRFGKINEMDEKLKQKTHCHSHQKARANMNILIFFSFILLSVRLWKSETAIISLSHRKKLSRKKQRQIKCCYYVKSRFFLFFLLFSVSIFLIPRDEYIKC